MNQKIAIIIGAGPAGLTASYELLDKTTIKPIIFEMSSDIGGISKTVNYKGNRIDMGGHAFFFKSDRVTKWWQNILPLQGSPSMDDIILNRNVPVSKVEGAPDPEKNDLVMLVRNLVSRIFFLRSFFEYPISIKWTTFENLGMVKFVRIGFSYIKTRLFPIEDEISLEEFFINRFGKELYLTFFKDYTEKVWGVPCNRIKPEVGARIRGLSIGKAIVNAVKRALNKNTLIDQKKPDSSLIEQFNYPKLGPGQLWEEVARQVKSYGGEIHILSNVVGVNIVGGQVLGVSVRNTVTNIITEYKCDFVLSTMPVKDLILAITPAAPDIVKKIAEGLRYRDFITVGVLLKKLKIVNETKIPTVNKIVPDSCIYIQERNIKLGRVQIYNNWSPYMVEDPDNTVWIGLEYFCNEGDELWKKSNDEFAAFAIDELAQIDIIDKNDVLDSTVIRMLKTYPVYYGSYDKFDVLKTFVNKYDNLFLIGRNGMHRYNSMDHSVLTAMTAVDNIINDIKDKDNIWNINAEED